MDLPEIASSLDTFGLFWGEKSVSAVDVKKKRSDGKFPGFSLFSTGSVMNLDSA